MRFNEHSEKIRRRGMLFEHPSQLIVHLFNQYSSTMSINWLYSVRLIVYTVRLFPEKQIGKMVPPSLFWLGKNLESPLFRHNEIFPHFWAVRFFSSLWDLFTEKNFRICFSENCFLSFPVGKKRFSNIMSIFLLVFSGTVSLVNFCIYN